MTVVNLSAIGERTTELHDGPLHGQFADRPNTKMRQENHPMAFRLPDKLQPQRPDKDMALMALPAHERKVRFAVYTWLSSEQRYCYTVQIDVSADPDLGKWQLDQALLRLTDK